MKTKALRAWVASLPLVLLTPVFIWFGFFAFTGGFKSFDLRWLVPFGYSAVVPVVVHFTAYLITGLPIFLLQFGKPESIIWGLPGALIIGGGLGGAALGSFGSMQLFLIGISYGMVTAIAAYRHRPRHHENAHHLP